MEDSACLPSARKRGNQESKDHRFKAIGSVGCCLGICPGPGCCCWSSPPRAAVDRPIAVGGHIMCAAISPSVPACQDGWSGCRPQHTLSPDPAPAPGAKLRPPPSTSGARGPQLNLLSSMYVGAGLVNPRARGREWTLRVGPCDHFL